MKKYIIIIGIVVISIVAITFYANFSYKERNSQVQNINQEYQNCYNKELLGTSIATLINKTMDLNEKNNIPKSYKHRYEVNDKNSVIIEIKFKENDNIYRMEQLHKAGMENFISNYSGMAFKCTKLEYHKKTKLVKYLYFEEV